jgi:hypothetical protein
MISSESELTEILDHVWGMLVRGGADKKHAYHFPVLATYGSLGIEQRTVILRKADKATRQLICYSDQRTRKVDDLQQQTSAHWLFYDYGSKEQIRAKVTVQLHHQNEVAKQVWQEIPSSARGDYVGPLPPGTLTKQYTDNLPDSFREEPTEGNTQQGIENFVLIISEVQQLDFLKLGREGHLRAQFTWNQTHWESSWLAP